MTDSRYSIIVVYNFAQKRQIFESITQVQHLPELWNRITKIKKKCSQKDKLKVQKFTFLNFSFDSALAKVM